MDNVLKHTYYQLKVMYEADVKAQNRHYAQIATACRVAQADKEHFAKYLKDMF